MPLPAIAFSLKKEDDDAHDCLSVPVSVRQEQIDQNRLFSNWQDAPAAKRTPFFSKKTHFAFRI